MIVGFSGFVIIAVLLTPRVSGVDIQRCYVCSSDTSAVCSTVTFNPATVPIETCVGGLCQKIITTNPSNKDIVLKTERTCRPASTAPPVPPSGCNTPTGTGVITCTCKNHLCNGEPMLAENPIRCYTCDSQNNPACADEPFRYNTSGIESKKCAPAEPCVTIRKIDLAGNVKSVVRRCSPPMEKMPVNEYNFMPYDSNTGTYESQLYCNTDNCNYQTTAARKGMNCYKCDSMAGVVGSEKACKALPLLAVDGVAPALCPDGVPCMTTRTDYPDGKVRIVRGCADKMATNGCVFMRLAGDVKESKCYYNSENGNNGLPFAKPPIRCYKCIDTDACKLAIGNTTTVPTEECLADVFCVTTKTRKKDRSETVSRGCSVAITAMPVSAASDGCVYSATNADGITVSQCFCNTERCNKNVTSVTNPNDKNGAVSMSLLSLQNFALGLALALLVF